MPKPEIPATSPGAISATAETATGFPAELPGDAKRQAVPAILGMVYQAWWSIDAWLQLKDANEVIYLEGAEDFDRIGHGVATAVQVKHHAGTLSLGNAKAREALENFWTLASRESSRHVRFHYLTTAAVAMEQDGDFDGLAGLDAWRAARTNLETVTKLANYLVAKLDSASPLRAFLTTATPEVIQQQVIHRFQWLTGQSGIDAVQQSVDDRLTVLLSGQGRSTTLAPTVRKYLEARFWELVLEKESSRRRLTFAELLRQVEAATTTYLPLPLDRLPDLIGGVQPGLGLFNLLVQKVPRPPEPLLRRDELTRQLELKVKQRQAVLLTGTVHKGKTTIAQLVASTLCPDAWWFTLTGRRTDQVDTLLLALATQIERNDCPGLIVIDDLDISPASHRVYRDSLSRVLHRARVSGRGILLTAQGASSEAALLDDFKNVEAIDIPQLDKDETTGLCVVHGCPLVLSNAWGTFVCLTTRGHPKLVQVRLAELAAKGWPHPTPKDLTGQSSGVVSAKQLARRLLSGSLPAPVAEFVYTISEASIPISRPVAISLAESVDGLTNPGDVLDSLNGKWLERLEGDLFRATSLLQGVVMDVWSEQQRKQVHVHLHDAILRKQLLDPTEAAALLFHAFISGEHKRLAMTAARLQVIDGREARKEVERQLLWLPYIGLEPSQVISEDPMADAVLRSLQFRVASTLDAESLPRICQRWMEAASRISQPQARAAIKSMMWMSIGSAENIKVPLEHRLTAISSLSESPDDQQTMLGECTHNFFKQSNDAVDLSPNGTATQLMLAITARYIRSAESLLQFMEWLNTKATGPIRQDFDEMLEWPLVQQLGAFVHGAWAACHQDTKDWSPWLDVLARVDNCAKRWGLHRLGREAAKAQAIILTEYLGRSAEALQTLDQAEQTFGPSAVLMEQRANVLFQVKDDRQMLSIWRQLTQENSITLDPFAYRRAGMSAARLGEWDLAKEIFRSGAQSVAPGTFAITQFGFHVDSAFAASLGGDQTTAARLLGEAVLALPNEASAERDPRWEAVQRAASEVCQVIKNQAWKLGDAKPKFEPGFASSPDLKVPEPVPGQPARIALLQAQALKLAASLGVALPGLPQAFEQLTVSPFPYARWDAAEVRLAMAFGCGAGVGFIEALLAFDAATTAVLNKRLPQSALEPDDGKWPDAPLTPERWFGLLAAGACCAGPNLHFHLEIWLEACDRLLGETAALTQAVRQIIEGASKPIRSLRNAVVDQANPSMLRCGAAARLLLEPLGPEETLNLHGFLASALVSDGSHFYQEICNQHVAKRFALAWHAYVQSPFLFKTPRVTLPLLTSTLKDIKRGTSTLRTLLTAASNALNRPLGHFVARLR